MDRAGDEKVKLAELDREQQAAADRADRDPAAAVVGVVLLTARPGVRVIEFGLSPSGDDVTGSFMPEVDAGLEITQRTGRRGVGFAEVRVSVWLPLRGPRGGLPVPAP